MMTLRYLAVALTGGACLAVAGNGKLSKDLSRVNAATSVDVIVQFRSARTDRQEARIARKGGRLKVDLGRIHAAVYTAPGSVLDDLSSDPDVLYISPDRKIAGSLEYANPTIGADLAQRAGFDGAGIGIAVIDSGITAKPDLNKSAVKGSRVVYQQSFVPGDLSTIDAYGHGTNVAGILAGNASDTTGPGYAKAFWGIAPSANFVNLRVLGKDGTDSDSAVLAAIDRAIQLMSQYNIRVINLFPGRPVYESYTLDPLCQAVERAWQAGIVVVVAAGNEGRNNSFGTHRYATIMSPGNDPLAITVGAMDDRESIGRGDDVIASYSSKGPTAMDHIVKPDIVVPGNRIISLLSATNVKTDSAADINRTPWKYYRDTKTTGESLAYYKLSGTSMAAPMVSGTVALMLDKDLTLTPDTVKARLMKTATKSFPAMSMACDPGTGACYTRQYDLFTIGAAYVDTWAAVKVLDIADGNTASPTAVYETKTGTIAVVNSDAAL